MTTFHPHHERHRADTTTCHTDLAIDPTLIAATAELAGLTVLHLDKDFELLAELTGQASERLRA